MQETYQKTGAMEQIIWKDHSFSDTRESRPAHVIERGLKHHVVNRTVGMIVFEDEERITLAHTARIDSDMDAAEYSRYTTIYKALIIERKRLMPQDTP